MQDVISDTSKDSLLKQQTTFICMYRNNRFLHLNGANSSFSSGMGKKGQTLRLGVFRSED